MKSIKKKKLNFKKKLAYIFAFSPVTAIFFQTSCGAIQPKRISIVKNNSPKAAIVIPDKATPTEKYAAEELQYHVEKASSAKLPICSERHKPSGFKSCIYIGNCRKTRNAGINVSALPPSGHIIKTVDNDLFLAGKDRCRSKASNGAGSIAGIGNHWCADWQGTLFAVYDLLENEMNVRWLWPGELGEIIPRSKDISFDSINRTGHPRFVSSRLRAPKIPSNSLGWKYDKNKEKFLKEQNQFLLRHRLAASMNMPYGHHFGNYWRRLGKTHPEFFNLLPNGKREPLQGDPKGKNITLCVSQPALWKQIVSDWKKNPERNPDHIPYKPYINACENDSPGMCACEKCRSWDSPDPAFESSDYWGKKIQMPKRLRFTIANATWGEDVEGKIAPSLSDRYAKFYVKVLETAKKEDPEARLTGYAYANYWEAPKNTKLNKDIIISYVPPLWFPYSKKISESFRRNWRGWINAGVEEMVLRPNLTHAGANLPIFYAKRFAGDFSYAAARGMSATYFDSLLGAWSAQGPTLYLLARIHEHPEWNSDKILDEYYSGFGKAKEAVKKYFEFWERHSDSLDEKTVKKYCMEERDSRGRPGGGFKNYVRIAHRLFPPESFAKARKFINKAIESARGDVCAERRVAFLEEGLTDAELTAATRAAQAKMEKSPTEENRKAFETAFKKLIDYRGGIEADNVCNFGYIAYREKYGSNWPHE